MFGLGRSERNGFHSDSPRARFGREEILLHPQQGEEPNPKPPASSWYVTDYFYSFLFCSCGLLLCFLIGYWLYLLSRNVASLALSLGQSSMLLFQEMAGSFSKLCHLTGQHSVSLTNFLQRGKVIKTLVLIKNTAIFIDTYKEQVYYSYSKRTASFIF